MKYQQQQQLLLPLLSASATPISSSSSSTNSSSVILRLLFIITIGVISIWANYEASKGFDITVINDINDSPAGKRFTLLYVSNDKAIRIIQNTSSFIQNFLYPNINYPKKIVNRVTLRFGLPTNTNLNNLDMATNHDQFEFVIHLSPSIMNVTTKSLDHQVTSMVLQGMTRIWLFRAPPWLLDGLVEYIKTVAGYSPAFRGFGGQFGLRSKDPRAVAEYLAHCEAQSTGFIQGLNQAFKDGWDDDLMVEDSVENLCNSIGRYTQ